MFKVEKKKKRSPSPGFKYRQVLIWNGRSRRDSGAFNQLAVKISLPASPPPSPGAKIWTNGGSGHTSGRVPREPKGRGDGH